jgi:hypothetical protein
VIIGNGASFRPLPEQMRSAFRQILPTGALWPEGHKAMTTPKKSQGFGAMTRRGLLSVLPAIPAIPLLASAPAEAASSRESTDKNQPAYTTTPHIEAFYDRSRF